MAIDKKTNHFTRILATVKGIAALGLACFFAACGDDSGSSSRANDDNSREVTTLAEMGRCSSEREGDTVYVAEKLTDYLCRNKSWVDLNEISDNESLCSSSNLGSSSSIDTSSPQGFIRENISVTGVAQKGPFKFDSPIILHEVLLQNDSLVFTGRKYIDEVSSNKGDFVIPKVNLVYPYAILEVRGQWRNEISGEWSRDSMTLYALTDLSNRDEVNVNLLTHLEIDRTMILVNKGYSVQAAKKQAEFEIMTAFGFATTIERAEDLKTFVSAGDAAHDANATLMAISLLFIGERNEAELSDAINNFKSDLAENGVWDDEQTKAYMADWAESFDGGSIRANVKSWNILDIPNYENFLTIFWNNAYELGGCASTRLGVVAQNKNEKSRKYNVHYICKTSGWQKATDYEKDTYQWANGKDGDVKKGNVTPTYYTFENGIWVVAKNENVLGLCNSKRVGELAKVDTTYFICRNEKWNYATALEYDTYGFGTGKDGEVRVGKVNLDQYYVYENGSWRSITNAIEKDLGACVTSRESEVGKSGNTYYICKSKKWITASAFEYDTYGWSAGIEGEVKAGNVSTGRYYVYENGTWRESASGLENNLGGCVTSREGEVGKAYETYYICKSMAWTEASVLEYDTYGWTTGTEGEVKAGNVNIGKYYVFENGTWRASANDVENNLGACVLSREGEIDNLNGLYYTCKSRGWQRSTILEYGTNLGACVQNREGEIGRVNETYYICKSESWGEASVLEYDTYGWTAGTEGEVKVGNVSTDKYYVFENGAWRSSANEVENNLGACVVGREGEVGNSEGVYYTCKSNEWQKSTVFEYDTYGWENGLDDEIRTGNVTGTYYVFKTGEWIVAGLENSLGLCTTEREGVVDEYQNLYYICKTSSWQIASALEYDTYTWGAGTEGEVRAGRINTSKYYVYENGHWRASTSYMENSLGACVLSREGEIGLFGSTYYICKLSTWQTATALEYNTYGWESGYEGEVRKGLINNYYIYIDGEWRLASQLEYNSYNQSCLLDGSIMTGQVDTSFKYVCDAGKFRRASTSEISLKKGCVSYILGDDYVPEKQLSHYKCESLGTWTFDIEKNLGIMTDSRDEKTYKTVIIGDRIWMAENLNYEVSGSSCYNGKVSNCDIYGRLYTYAMAMNKSETECGYKHTCSFTRYQKIQGICPDGWHVSNQSDVERLFSAVGGQSVAAKALKSKTGWRKTSFNGTDQFGFTALPSGYKYSDSAYSLEGFYAVFWSSTESDSTRAYSMKLSEDNIDAELGYFVKNAAASIRCVKD